MEGCNGSRKKRTSKAPVVGDHRRVGKGFVPPFVAMLGPLNSVKWIDDLPPEVLWLGMLNEDRGLREGARWGHASISTTLNIVSDNDLREAAVKMNAATAR